MHHCNPVCRVRRNIWEVPKTGAMHAWQLQRSSRQTCSERSAGAKHTVLPRYWARSLQSNHMQFVSHIPIRIWSGVYLNGVNILVDGFNHVCRLHPYIAKPCFPFALAVRAECNQAEMLKVAITWPDQVALPREYPFRISPFYSLYAG